MEKKEFSRLQKIWSDKSNASLLPSLQRLQKRKTFCAFNVVIDAVSFPSLRKISEIASKESITKIPSSLPSKKISSKKDFLNAFLFCFSNGKALELPCFSQELFEWFSSEFPSEKRMGGQAGIVSNLLSSLGSTAICYSPSLSKEQALFFNRNKVFFPVSKKGKLRLVSPVRACRKNDATRTNGIFEFRKNDALILNGKKIPCPRSNRLIVSSRYITCIPSFRKEEISLLPQIASSSDRAFLAGFQSFHGKMPKHASATESFMEVADELAKLREKGNMKIHLEYVAMHEPSIECRIYPKLAKLVDSFGLNEMETIHLLRVLNRNALADKIAKTESASSLYQGGLEIFERLKLNRLHIHFLGFFILFLRKNYAKETDIDDFQDSLLFASRVADARANFGSAPSSKQLLSYRPPKISLQGIEQLNSFFSELSKSVSFANPSFSRNAFLENGILELPNHYFLIVPTSIIHKPKSTVGLGDTISASAFVSEP